MRSCNNVVGIEKLPGVKGLTYPWKNHLCRQPCKTYAIDLKQENFIIPERNTCNYHDIPVYSQYMNVLGNMNKTWPVKAQVVSMLRYQIVRTDLSLDFRYQSKMSSHISWLSSCVR